jgi:hypothetical protein
MSLPPETSDVYTNTGAPAQSVTVTIAAARAQQRPFVVYAECQATAGELDIFIGGMKICSKGRNRTGLWIGAIGDTVTVVADGSVTGQEYICTLGFIGQTGGLSSGGPTNMGSQSGGEISGVDSV